MGKTTIALTATVVVLGVTILFIIILVVIYSIRYRKLVAALSVAIDNDIFCEIQEGVCRLEIDEELVEPTTVDGIFRYDVSRYCADIIARVELLFYKKNGLTKLHMPRQLELDTTLFFKNKIIGFVAKSRDTGSIWIAFRGTANESEWRQDFNFSQVDITLSDTENQNNFALRNGEVLSCHSGFLNVFNEFKECMLESLRRLNPEKIIVTGHSLGASLATLASLELASQYENVYTYAFASPRVCDRIPPITSAFFRLSNTEDVVTTIPLSVMPNTFDKNRPYIYTHGGTSMEFTDNRKSLTNNHLLVGYINAIDKRKIKQVTALY